MVPFVRGLLLCAAMTAPAYAHPGGHDDGVSAPAPKPTAPTTAIPETYVAVVDALKTNLAAADTARAAFKLVDLRRHCTSMKDLAVAAPGKANGLAAADAATLATTVVHLQEQLTALTTAAEKGDAAAGDAAMTALRADVETLAQWAK